ncbi:hypothetical protein [Frateuria sp. YIM B11624]|uniref:Nmad3 family putative nucleotide modification protein n=1 Tax=Frateuria sp. YIM B11624 TaxID=3143185 RepID=UPI003C71002F
MNQIPLSSALRQKAPGGGLPPEAVGPRKLVLSRKGFDAGYGGMPSPILPDGTLLPLPIPSQRDAFKLGQLNTTVDLAPLLADLSDGVHSMDTCVHMDPDLDRRADLQSPGWRPAFGQSGAAQSHLEGQGVGPGDLLLFFGWFRQVEQVRGRWRYAWRSPQLHVLFGWLEIEQVLSIGAGRADAIAQHPWIATHPHIANHEAYTSPNNALYVARKDSALAEGCPGGGLFRRFSPSLQLTDRGEKNRSIWSLPEWFHPDNGREPLSYHGNLSRWSKGDGLCRLKSVAKGQEFVLDIGGLPQATEWATDLITAH